MDHEPKPCIDLCQMGLLPAKWRAQSHQCTQEGRSELRSCGQAEEPAKIINEDKAPVNLGEEVVEDPQEQGRHSAPVELSTCHAVGAHLVDPPFVVQLCDLETPVLGQDFDPSVGLSDVRFQQDPLAVLGGPLPDGE